MLIARIFEVFPLVCPLCAGQMRIIAFIADGAKVRKILEHIGVDAQAYRITPARGPPLWDDCEVRWWMALKSNSNATYRHRSHRTTRSISAPVGDYVKSG